jgi:hypothetical protein
VQHCYHMLKIRALATLHELTVFPHLRIQTNLVDRVSKYHSQASHLVRPHLNFCFNIITKIVHLRNNSRTFINRLNFPWFLNLVFFIVFHFILFLSSFSFFIPVYTNNEKIEKEYRKTIPFTIASKKMTKE